MKRCLLFAIPLSAGAWACACLIVRGLYLVVSR